MREPVGGGSPWEDEGPRGRREGREAAGSVSWAERGEKPVGAQPWEEGGEEVVG